MVIIDAFPDVKVRSTISVYDYEIWLKIVGTEKIISEEESKSIYLSKKQEIISEINWEEEDYEWIFFLQKL